MLDFITHHLANEYVEKKQFSRLTPAIVYANDVIKTMSDAELVALLGCTLRTMAIKKTGENNG